MATKTIQFFARTNSDLCSVLDAVEAQCGIKDVECGLFDVADRPAFATFRRRPTDSARIRQLLFLLSQEGNCKVRTVAQRRGGLRYAVDQMANPGTVVLKPGIDKNDSALVAGTMGTIHGDNTSSMLMRIFAAEVKSRFQRIKNLGGRTRRRDSIRHTKLTHSITAPPDYDLSLP